jgi:hypothetical protein
MQESADETRTETAEALDHGASVDDGRGDLVPVKRPAASESPEIPQGPSESGNESGRELSEDGWGVRSVDSRVAREMDDFAGERTMRIARARKLVDQATTDNGGDSRADLSALDDPEQAARVAAARPGVGAEHDRSPSPPMPDLETLLEHDLPVDAADIAQRTSDNRINLADDVPSANRCETYGGYLDLVMHGDENGTEAHLDGSWKDFTLDDTVKLIEDSPAWDRRPIRLMSCSTGKRNYAQALANRLGVPVYAPSDILQINDDGSKFMYNSGSWRRFEPVIR